uniref:Gypsy retrotransposon integrase-like protein 1 n=1 Tax=Astyanax mexicanus TaxID=7994 RepID=A0A3B1J813_ASTMX
MEWETGARTRSMMFMHHLPQLVPPGQDSLPAYSERELYERQCADGVLSRVLYYVQRHRRPSRRERVKEPPAVIRYLKHWEKLTVRNGILYRVSRDPATRFKRFQFLVPQSLISEVLKGVHDHAGHQGQFRSLGLARQRFFWLNQDKDVREYVRTCQRCVVSKTADPEGRAPLENIVSSRPLELVCIDFWSAEDAQNRSVDVLVVTDHFTRLSQAFVCRDQSAKQVARVLWDKYFCIYGFPERIHSDQGASFESQLISELLRVSGVRKSHTTPYHPMGNGSVERFNRTLGSMIRALAPAAKRDWPRHLQTLTFLYNSTVHETTGYAPFYLMFGRVPRLPVDVLFRSVLCDPNISSYDKYVESLTEDLKAALHLAQEHALKEQSRHKRIYDRKVKGLNIDIGDRVLLANKSGRGKQKVADKWESTVYVVLDRNADTHTYRIQNTATGQEKVVHRNLLMLVNFLPIDVKSTLSDPVSTLSNCSSETQSPSLMGQDGQISNCMSNLGHGNMEADASDGAISTVSRSHSESLEQEALDNDLENDRASLIASGADSEGRTIDWIQQLPDTCSQPVSETNKVRELRTSSSQASLNDFSVMSSSLEPELQPDSPIGHTDANEMSTVTVQPCTDQSQSNDAHCSDTVTEPHNPAPHTQARSRFGRVVKPVNRIIFTMSGQGLLQDAKHNVQAVCRSMFQALKDR